MDRSLEKCTHDATFLLSQCSAKKETFYDERESLVHTIDQGVIELDTPYIDYTTYFVSLLDGNLVVRKDANDARGRRMSAIAMEDDDYVEVERLLGELADGLRSQIALRDVGMKAAASSLLDALFSHPALGPRPGRAPTLTRNSHEIGVTVNRTLQKAKRQATFEWKDWAEVGVHAVNKMAPLKALGIKLAAPSAAEATAVRNAHAFSAAVLGWFHQQLAPHDLMLVAISPLDELQQFSLVSISGFKALRESLKLLNVAVEAPLEQ